MIYKVDLQETAEYTAAVVEEGLPMVGVLEDMAQVAGYSVPVVAAEGDSAQSPYIILSEDNPQLIVEANSPEEAEKVLGILEKNAQAIYEGQVLGGAIPLDETLALEERKFYLENYSKREEENVLSADRPFPLAAEAVVDLSESLMTLGYLKWTWGNLSLRFGSENMLITPSGRGYVGMTGADIVKVNIATGEWDGELMPSSEKDLHRLIYQAFPEARVIIHTHAPNSSVFAAARKSIEFEEDEACSPAPTGSVEQVDIATPTNGAHIPVADFAPAGTIELAENVVKAMMTPGAAKGALMANHGLICFGDTITEAFDLCRKIEEEAERMLNV